MQKWSFLIASLLILGFFIAESGRDKPAEAPIVLKSALVPPQKESPKEALLEPADHFYLMRSYPDPSFDIAAYDQALKQAMQSMKTTTITGIQDTPWLLEGPTNTGGRINAIAIDPNNPNVILEGAPAGGIFKTTDGGTTWQPVFDAQPYLAIGEIVYQPGSSQVVYAGTGDPNIGGYPFIGNGVYKSTDGGTTWTHLGLDNTRTTARIVIDPVNVNTVYVATMGLPMERDNNRGLYKSTDGGATWTQSLFVADQAGVIDVQMDPNNSQVLYASSWDRIRTNQESMVEGPNGKVWKTTNGGTSWTQLTNGLPAAPMSRINLVHHPTSSGIVYAAYIDGSLNLYNIYKTTDAGGSWNAIDISTLDPWALGGFGWYFGNIYLNPYNPNDLYLLGVDFFRTSDDGATWVSADPNFYTHADKHDLAFTGPTSYYLGTDGGLYRTTDNGNSWQDRDEIPNSQMYRVAVNPHISGQYAAGFQDNGTGVGGSATVDGWSAVYWADGFQPLFDSNPQHMVAESQNGGLAFTEDGGFLWNDFTLGIDFNDRRNWDMPVTISSHDDDTYYTGTYRLYRNTTGLSGHNWMPISGDLTDGIIFAPRFHNITTIAELPVNSQILYVGTSDGNVQRTTNGGITWANVSAGLPKRYVTSVKASPLNVDEVFVTTSGYKYNDYLPHVFRSTNNGTTWTDISGDLPPLALNDVVIHPTIQGVYVVASDGGVYATQNAGTNWVRVGLGMPVCPVYDMEWDVPGRKLIAGTHARSMLSFPMDSLASGMIIHVENGLPMAGIEVFPNPVDDVLQVGQAVGFEKWEVMDVQGKVLMRGNFAGDAGRISVEELAGGAYFLRAIGANGAIAKRFVKRKS